MTIEEVYHDRSYVVKATGRIVVVNQIDRQGHLVADVVGNWYYIDEIADVEEQE